MKRKYIGLKTYCLCFSLVVILFFKVDALFAQKNYLDKEIAYIDKLPLIDGKLDEAFQTLEIREFPVKYKNSENNPDIEVTCRLAYSADFLYVFIEAETDDLQFRDRAYQNGDGFQLLIAKPMPGSLPTEEFYVLAASAVNKKSMEWSKRLFWYYNVSTIFKKTSEDTKLAYATNNGKIGFELILPWKDVYPYHPWHSEAIGFNLIFVKGIEQTNVNLYALQNESLGRENSPRKYLYLTFEKPEASENPKLLFYPKMNTLKEGELVQGTLISLSRNAYSENLMYRIYSGENSLLNMERKKVNILSGMNKQDVELGGINLTAGGYKLEWKALSAETTGEYYLSLLPGYQKTDFLTRLEEVKPNLSSSSYATIVHQINETFDQLNRLKEYETAGQQRINLSTYLTLLDEAKNGKDVLASKKGFVRKAYKSDLDSSYLPYMVYLPDNYSPGKKYPLYVYLHGSSSDETNLLGARYQIPEGFIALAPNGRGPSNCYAWDNAQTDIREAIDEVIQTYSIDEEKIVLAGFSMGGYGVLRTYLEMPHRFKALAVFSGHPDIANERTGNKGLYPNFFDEQQLKKFKEVPVFVFHGTADRNCPYEKIEEMVRKMKSRGVRVEFVTEKDKGHESANAESIRKFHQWLGKWL